MGAWADGAWANGGMGGGGLGVVGDGVVAEGAGLRGAERIGRSLADGSGVLKLVGREAINLGESVRIPFPLP